MLVSSSDICMFLEDGFWGGITCADGWEPWFLDCGCGCTPVTHPQAEQMLYSDTMVPHGLDTQVSLTSVLVLVVAVLAVYQVYSYCVSKNNGGYHKVEERPANYHI